MGSKNSTNNSSEPPPRSAAQPKPQMASQPSTSSKPTLPTIPKAADGWRLPPRYDVKKSIGKGSYGSVSECFDKEKQILVAAKQMMGLFDDLVDCKRILRELAILTKLDSDSVVRVHDIVVPEPIPSFTEIYIILEICDSDMKKLIRTDVMLSEMHINTLLYNLLVGVKYIHSAGVYHRDLKPANCLVNQNCSVKICDFGLARAIGGEERRMTGDVSEDDDQGPLVPVPLVPATLRRKRNMTQHVVTRWYRAPELILLQHGYTEAIDMWSVGCIYAELLQMQEDAIRFNDRGPLFPGSSCFPLSPQRRKAQGGQKQRAPNDQLEMIFSIIGVPSEEEMRRLENDDARRYVQSFEPRKGDGVGARFPSLSPQAIQLLSSMLRFSPEERLRVQTALEHPVLAEVRDASRETLAARYIKLDWEKPEMDEAELRTRFGEELNKFLQK